MSKFLHRRYQALEAYIPGEQPRDQQYIKLNTNESPYPPAPSVQKAIGEGDIAQLRLYSDPTGLALKEKLAALYGLTPEQVFLANGSDEALNFAFMAFGEEGVAYPDISYGFYSVFAQLHGIPAQVIPLREDFSLAVEDYYRCGKLVVIANPNAPTGMGLGLEALRRLLEANREHVVLVDEAYVDFGGTTALPLLPEFDNLLIVRTFSKSRCLAGGRLGYAFGSRELIADLEKIKFSTNPYNLDRLTLLLGQATVAAEDYYREKCQAIQETREQTRAGLEAMGFTILPSQANFLFARSDAISGGELYRSLKARGILVRHFGNPRIADFVRITIGTPEDMAALLATIKTILGGTP